MSYEPRRIKFQKSGIDLCYYGKMDKAKTPLLFVHGSGGNGFLWKQQLRGLAATYSTIALDLPGHGNSTGNSCQSVSLYGDYIRELKESLALPPFTLCGHSLGGAIALDYQLNYPEELKAIILVATGCRLRVASEFLERYGRGEKMPELARYLYGSDASAKMIREGEKYIMDVPARVWHDDFTACNDFDVLSELHKINVPVLILCGTEDQMTPPKYSHYLKQKIPGAKLELFPGSGHMLMLEKPREVNNAIQGFVDELL